LLLPTLAWLGGGSAMALCLRGQRIWVAEQRRELVGGWLLAIALFGTSTLAVVYDSIETTYPAWQFLALHLAAFTTLLASQRSLLMILVASAALLLVTLVLQPTVELALLLCGATALLLATQAGLEHRQRSQTAQPERLPLDPGATWPTTLSLAAIAIALPLLALACYSSLPPSYPLQPRELVQQWSWRLGIASLPAPANTLLEPADKALPVSETAGRPASALATLSFARDIKFGNLAPHDPTLERTVLRVRLRDRFQRPTPALGITRYWAIQALAHYDDGRWHSGPNPVRSIDPNDLNPSLPLTPRDDPALLLQEVLLAPFHTRGLPALHPIEQVLLERYGVDEEGMLVRLDALTSAIRYRLLSRPIPLDARKSFAPAPAAARYHAIPTELLAAPLFQRWLKPLLAEHEPHARIDAAFKQLARCSYSLSPTLPSDQDPTLAFLAQRQGYCQHFASALALLLRGAGIGCRLVTGYTSGEWVDSDAYYHVRRRDAHSWVEVPDQRYGWLVLDPLAFSAVLRSTTQATSASTASIRTSVAAPSSSTASSAATSATAKLSSAAATTATTPAASASAASPGSLDATSSTATSSRATAATRSTPHDRPSPEEHEPSLDGFELLWQDAADPTTAAFGTERGSDGAHGPTTASTRWQADSTLWTWIAWEHPLRLLYLLVFVIVAGHLLGRAPANPRRRQASSQAPARLATHWDDPPPPPGSASAQIIAAYRSALLHLASVGLPLRHDMTASEYARTLPLRWAPAIELTALFLQARFDRRPVSASHVPRASALLAQLRAS
jgi:hypothetical protein